MNKIINKLLDKDFADKCVFWTCMACGAVTLLLPYGGA